MDITYGLRILFVFASGYLFVAEALDPYYFPRAKVYRRGELSASTDREHERWLPSARKCRKIGERAAKKSISCIADEHFYENLSNRVQLSNFRVSEHDRELKELASRISKCSVKYARYFERGCSLKTTYLNARRRCRRLRSRQARTECKGEIRRRYFSR